MIVYYKLQNIVAIYDNRQVEGNGVLYTKTKI